MATQPPNPPPQYPPPYAYMDARAQRQAARAQAQAARAQYRAARAQARAMRRRSVLGPVILLGLGIVLLLSTTRMIDPHSLFLWYGQWWPLLLIAGGAILLLEWALDTRAVNSGIPRGTRIGGGAVWLIILLIWVGLASGFSRNRDWGFWRANFGNDEFSSMFMGPQHQADQELTQSIPAGAIVSVENQRGDITIASSNQPVLAGKPAAEGTLQISMHKTIYGGSDNEAQKRLDDFKPNVTTSGNRVIVRVDGSNNASANLVLTLPATAVLDLHSHHGDIDVTGQQADVSFESNHGDVKLDGIKGAVRGKIDHGDVVAHSIQGDVYVDGRHFSDVTVSDITGKVTLQGDFYGDTHVEHVSAPFHLHSSRTDYEVAKLDGSFSLDTGDLTTDQAAGPLKLSTRSKDINLNRISGDVNVENSNGSVDVEAALPLGEYNIKNRNGHVKVTLPENAGFTVDAHSYQGDLENDFNLNKSGSEHNGELSGTVGKGGPRLTLIADHGDVELRKGEVGNLTPPTPPTPPHIVSPKPPKVKAVVPAPPAPETPSTP